MMHNVRQLLNLSLTLLQLLISLLHLYLQVLCIVPRALKLIARVLQMSACLVQQARPILDVAVRLQQLIGQLLIAPLVGVCMLEQLSLSSAR
jgi:hypothetical protein